MPAEVCVNDIRRAIQDLPGSSAVLIQVDNGPDRELTFAWGAHDGRYGPVLLLKIGGYVSPFNSGGCDGNS